jgi:toxin ParE1/3/4
MTLIWSPESIHDLISLRAHIAVHDPVAAKRAALHILYCVEHLLSENPQLGNPGRVPRTRELVIPQTPYIVPYRIRGTTIEVARVSSTSQARRAAPSMGSRRVLSLNLWAFMSNFLPPVSKKDRLALRASHDLWVCTSDNEPARASGEGMVSTREPHFYDAETISMLKSAFDETCATVPAERLTQAMRASIAEHILKIAGTGERDRVRLRTRALMEVASNERD